MSANSKDVPSHSLGMFIAGESNPGGRKHMEDYIVLKSETDTSGQAFFAVFDGHGGKEAAKFARDNLWATIKSCDGFDSKNSERVAEAIAAGFAQTHEAMWKVRDTWKRTKGGDPSTSGTTVACAIVQQDRMYIANVGDSTIVLGKKNLRYGEPGEPEVVAEMITKDHKPDDKKEKERIEALGGNVLMSNKGVMRVVWERKRPSSAIGVVDRIPFLSVARSLGDLWSTTPEREYLVSPVPDVYVHYFDLKQDRFVVLASDGLWNMMRPQHVVEMVHSCCKDASTSQAEASSAAHQLVTTALDRWKKRNLTADNISALIGFFREIKKDTTTDDDASAVTTNNLVTQPSSEDEGIEVSTPSPVTEEDTPVTSRISKTDVLQHSPPPDDEENELGVDSLQANCCITMMTTQKLGKRKGVQSDCLVSPKKTHKLNITPSSP